MNGLSDHFFHFYGVIFPEDGRKDGVKVVIEKAVGEGSRDIGDSGDMVELFLQGVEVLTVFIHNKGD